MTAHAPAGRDAVAPGVAPGVGDPGSTTNAVRGVSTLVGDTASMFGGRLASIALSFLSVLMTTRLLHAVGYGRVAYFTVVAMLIFTVTSGWTSAAVARYGREEMELRGSLFTTSWNRLLIMTPLFLLAAAVVPLLKVLHALPPEFSWVFVWLVLAYGATLVVGEHVRYLLEASGRMKLSALGIVCQQAAFVAAVGAVAVTVIACATVTLAGAVYNPFEIDPTTGLIDHVTAVLLVPVTVAVNWLV